VDADTCQQGHVAQEDVAKSGTGGTEGFHRIRRPDE
jgi:hypothetical protein